MSTSLMYHTQGIRNFQHESYRFEGKSVIERIRRKSQRCPNCGSSDVTVKHLRCRQIKGLLCGSKEMLFEFDVHRIYCPECGQRQLEKFDFLSHPKARITKSLERTIIEMRPKMCITDLADHYGVSWHTVKNCEKHHLAKKYRTIKLKNVRGLGIDEIYVSRVRDEKYLTVVRDIESGAVLFVGEGKGVEALAPFSEKLRRSSAKIEYITMDMSNAFASWAKTYCPNAEIVYDHFHVIKLMNERLDNVRRRTVKELDEKEAEFLKKQRYLFLHNREDLTPECSLLLNNLRGMFKELGDTHLMKEALRGIYAVAKDECQATDAFKRWSDMADETNVPELISMAKTIRNHLSGIVAYWRYDRVTNAAMEGFNNKIRWLAYQAYGYHD